MKSILSNRFKAASKGIESVEDYYKYIQGLWVNDYWVIWLNGLQKELAACKAFYQTSSKQHQGYQICWRLIQEVYTRIRSSSYLGNEEEKLFFFCTWNYRNNSVSFCHQSPHFHNPRKFMGCDLWDY